MKIISTIIIVTREQLHGKAKGAFSQVFIDYNSEQLKARMTIRIWAGNANEWNNMSH
jgi:hypothetical protein